MCLILFNLLVILLVDFHVQCLLPVTSFRTSTFKGFISKKGHINREIWRGGDDAPSVLLPCSGGPAFFTLTFWDIRTRDICNACSQTYRNNRTCNKVAYFFRIMQTSRVNNSKILGIKNVKFSRNCFDKNPNI